MQTERRRVDVGPVSGTDDRKSTIAAVPADFFEVEKRGSTARTETGAYIESATGIRDGARTGLAAVTTGVLFLASLFFIPLVEPLQSLRYAYAPALVVVGLLMLASARHIAYHDMTELVPAFATIALLVFTYNIANGLTAGLALHPIVKVAAGRAREVRPGAWVLAAMSFLYYGFGIPH